MATISEIGRFLDELLPRSLSASWDNDGLMVCADPNKKVSKILFSLDITSDAIRYASDIGADLILSHHPLIFRGIRHLDGADSTSRKAMLLLRAGISAMSFHTRLDAADGGINDILADLLGLSDTERFGPEDEKMGRIGTWKHTMSFEDFCLFVKNTLNAPSICVAQSGNAIHRVAVLGGAGKDFIDSALRAGADVLVTGEAGYHPMLDAAENGLSVIAAGHYYTEIPFSLFFIKTLGKAFPDIEFCRFPGGCALRCL